MASSLHILIERDPIANFVVTTARCDTFREPYKPEAQCRTLKKQSRLLSLCFKDASSSDSDLLHSSPVWPPRPRSPPQNIGTIPKAKPVPMDASLSDSAKSVSSQEAEEAAKGK